MLVVTFSLIELANVNCVVLVTSADLAAQFQHFSLIFLTHSFSFCVARFFSVTYGTLCFIHKTHICDYRAIEALHSATHLLLTLLVMILQYFLWLQWLMITLLWHHLTSHFMIYLYVYSFRWVTYPVTFRDLNSYLISQSCH